MAAKVKKELLQQISNDFVGLLEKNKVAQIHIARIIEKDKSTVSKIYKGTRSFTLDDIHLLSCEYNIPSMPLIFKYMGTNSDAEAKALKKVFISTERETLQGIKDINSLDDDKLVS